MVSSSSLTEGRVTGRGAVCSTDEAKPAKVHSESFGGSNACRVSTSMYIRTRGGVTSTSCKAAGIGSGQSSRRRWCLSLFSTLEIRLLWATVKFPFIVPKPCPHHLHSGRSAIISCVLIHLTLFACSPLARGTTCSRRVGGVAWDGVCTEI